MKFEEKIVKHIEDNLDFGKVITNLEFPKQGMSGFVFFATFKEIGEVAIKYGDDVNKDLFYLELVKKEVQNFPTPKILASFNIDNKYVLVLEKLKGTLFGDVSLENLPKYFDNVVETLKDLHKINISNFNWEKYLLEIFENGALNWEVISNRKNIDKDLVIDARKKLLVEIRKTNLKLPIYSLLHTDFNQSNLLVDENTNKITGVLDWEEATFGDSIYDFARFHLHLWHRGVGENEINNFLNLLNLSIEEKKKEIMYFNIFLLHYLAYYSEQENDFCIGRIKMHQDYLRKQFAPSVYLLCGLPGSGKSTWSEKFVKENPNTVWYKLDKEFFLKHKSSFYGDKFQEYEDEVKKNILEKVKVDLQNGKDVILDYGFWKKVDREEYKKIILDLGAEPKLLYFKQDNQTLLKRLEERNSKKLEHEHIITEELFNIFITKFEEPNSEENSDLI